MGARGPQRSPLSVRGRLEGGREGVPRPEPGRPDAPAWFAASPFLPVWEAACGLLEDMSLLTKADGPAVERYCVSLFLWRRAAEFLARNGDTYTKRSPNPTLPYIGVLAAQPNAPQEYAVEMLRYPHHGLLDQYDKACKSFEQAFGLNPAARGRMTAPLPGPSLPEGDEPGYQPAVRVRVRG